MLKGVVDTAAGTGVRAKIPGYTVAGKTGTAQKALAHGGYSKTDYVASFVGFFPADDPQVEVMVVVDSPRGNIFGGLVAAPAFQEIGTFLTQALSIRPDRRCGRPAEPPGWQVPSPHAGVLPDAAVRAGGRGRAARCAR